MSSDKTNNSHKQFLSRSAPTDSSAQGCIPAARKKYSADAPMSYEDFQNHMMDLYQQCSGFSREDSPQSKSCKPHQKLERPSTPKQKVIHISAAPTTTTIGFDAKFPDPNTIETKKIQLK